MKSKISKGLSLAAAIGMVAGNMASIARADTKSEGQLDILAWPGYIERGDNDKNYDWVTDFEKNTGCKVNVKVAGTSDEMVSLMNEGGFDLVTASGDASLRLIAGKRVQPIDVAKIKDYSSVDPRLQSAAWHTVGTTHYGVPYQWGANVLAYNSNVFKEPPKSWSVVFEEQNLPDGKSNKGRVQAFDGPIYIADAALYLMTKKPDLGIKDPYELTEDQYKAAVDLLRGQRALVGRYWHDANVQVDDFKNEGVVASSSWPFQVNTLQADKDVMAKTPVASTIPQEGATGWADTTMMGADAAHPDCAYAWLNHSIEPKVQGDVAAWFGSVPAVPAACKGNALLTDDGCATNGSANFEKIHFWKTPVAKCASQPAGCVPYHRWVSDMIGVLGGR